MSVNYLDKSLKFLKKSDISIGTAWQNVFKSVDNEGGYFLSCSMTFSSDKPSIKVIVDGIVVIDELSPGFLASTNDLGISGGFGFVKSLHNKNITLDFGHGIKVKESFKIQAKSGGGDKTMNAGLFTYYLNGATS